MSITEDASHESYRGSLRSSSKRVPNNPSSNGVRFSFCRGKKKGVIGEVPACVSLPGNNRRHRRVRAHMPEPHLRLASLPPRPPRGARRPRPEGRGGKVIQARPEASDSRPIPGSLGNRPANASCEVGRVRHQKTRAAAKVFVERNVPLRYFILPSENPPLLDRWKPSRHAWFFWASSGNLFPSLDTLIHTSAY